MTLNIATNPVKLGNQLDLNKSDEDDDLEDGEILEEGEVGSDEEEEEKKENCDKQDSKEKHNKENLKEQSSFIEQNNINSNEKKRKSNWRDSPEVDTKKIRKTEDSNNDFTLVKNTSPPKITTAPPNLIVPPPPEDDDYYDEDELMCVRGASPTRNESSNLKMLDDRGPPPSMDEDYFDYDENQEDGDGDYRKRHGQFNRGGRGGRRGDNRRGDRGRGRWQDGRKGVRGGFRNEHDSNHNDNMDGGEIDGICQYYMQGKCSRGDNCIYSHDAEPPRKMELCKFYLLECCAKKDKCLYMHGDFPCKYFHTGMQCIAWDNNECKFSHGPLQEDHKSILIKHIESAPKEILGDFPRLTREAAILLINNKIASAPPAPIPSLFDIRIPENVKHAADSNTKENDNSTPLPSDGEEIDEDDEQRLIKEEEERKERKRKEKELHKLEKAKRKAERELRRAEKAAKKLKNMESTGGKKKDKKKRSDSEDDEGDHSHDEKDEKKKVKDKKKKRKKSDDEEEEEEEEDENKLEIDEKEEEGIPAHLPEKQKELYLRIQRRHQKKAEKEQSSDSSDNDQTEEHWYSSDDESATPLATILKTINQKTSLPKPKIPLLPTPTNIPNTPGYIDPTLNKQSYSGDMYSNVTNIPLPAMNTNNMIGTPNQAMTPLAGLNNINMNHEDVSRILSSLQNIANPNMGCNISSQLSLANTTNTTFNNNSEQTSLHNQMPHLANAIPNQPAHHLNPNVIPTPHLPEPIKPVKRDPRLLRASGGTPSLEQTSAETPSHSQIHQPTKIPIHPVLPPTTPNSLKDIDLRLPTIANLVHTSSLSRDIDLRNLPFKPVPMHETCEEIDATINSHPPLTWKLVACHFKILKYFEDPVILAKASPNDPRLNPDRCKRRRSSDEVPVPLASPSSTSSQSPSTSVPPPVLARDPRKGMSAMPGRSDPRIAQHMSDRRTSDPRQAPDPKRSPDLRSYDPRFPEAKQSPDTRPHDNRFTDPKRSPDSRTYDPRFQEHKRSPDTRSYDPRIQDPKRLSDTRPYDPRYSDQSRQHERPYDPRQSYDPRYNQEKPGDPRMKRVDPRINQSTDNGLGYKDKDLRTTDPHHRFQQDIDLRLPPPNYHPNS